jgi:sec-independent protein translocase protein TatB
VFNNLGWGELVVLFLVAMFVFGPERLPKVAADAGRMLRQLRKMAKGATEDLRAELGPELADLDLASLNPRTFVAKHLLSDDEDEEERPSLAAYRPLAPGERPPYDVDAT